MSSCPYCGNEVQEGNRFCGSCGNSLTQTTSKFAHHQWAVVTLSLGGLLGLVGLFTDWSAGEANVLDFLDFAFIDGDLPWWIGVIALAAIAGVVVTVLNIVTAVRRRSLPSNWRLRLGGILVALCPIGTHTAFTAWVATPLGQNVGEFWDWFWLLQGAGLWISLAGGVLVIWATSIGNLLSSPKN